MKTGYTKEIKKDIKYLNFVFRKNSMQSLKIPHPWRHVKCNE